MKAHIIPEAFFRRVRAGEHTLLMLASKPPFSKRRPIGIYDPCLLCGECELKFASVDDYAATVLLNSFDTLFAPLVSGGQTIAYESTQVDQSMLLVRISLGQTTAYLKVDSRPYGALFSRVSLGANPVLRVLGRDFATSLEFKSMLHTAQAADRRGR